MIKQNSARPNWLWRHKKFSLLISLIILVVAGFYIYEKVALELNKRSFEQARSAIDTVYADIVRQVGQPDNSRRYNECSKGYSGPYNLIVTCGVDIDLVYKIDSDENANKTISEIQNIVKLHSNLLTKTSKPQSDIVVNPAPGTSSSDIFDYYKTKMGMICTIRYVYNNEDETDLKDPKSAENILFMTFGCSDNAKQQYYPLNL